jgi:hypothetical protein
MMKTTRFTGIIAVVLLGLCGESRAQLQDVTVTRFDAARLEQIVAPIALYPDSLLTHVMMAATYPIEVVEADRWVRANPNVTGDALQTSLSAQSWDPSVKALAGLPDVLKLLSENLDWTRDLGDAFLAQRTELMDAVQRMRARAKEAGTLQSTEQQTVVVQDPGTIVIESRSPEVIYVPIYSPRYVYGGWSYPTWYYPSFYGSGYYGSGYGYNGYGYGGYGSGLAFSIGFNWGNWLWGYPNWGWGSSNVYVNATRYNRFNRYWGSSNWSQPAYAGDQYVWRHSPRHRHGVRYRDPAIAREFGVTDQFVTRQRARGFESTAPRTTTERVEPARISPDRRIREEVTTPTPVPATPPRTDRSPARTERIERAPVRTDRTERIPARVERREVGPAPRSSDVRRAPEPRSRVQQPRTERAQRRSSTTWSGSRNPQLDRKASDRGSRSRDRGGAQRSRNPRGSKNDR